jgi:hypothetical protein
VGGTAIRIGDVDGESNVRRKLTITVDEDLEAGYRARANRAIRIQLAL